MEEDISARMDRERLERKLMLDARQFVAATENPKKAQPASSRRYEDLRRSTNNAPAVVTPRQEATGNKPQNFNSISFYAWKAGVAGQIKLAISNDFSPI